MIIANIKDAKRYIEVNQNFEKAFEFLKTLTKDSQKGPFEFEGFRGNVMEIENLGDASENKETVLEAHRDYLDIHYVIDGSEAIGYANIDTLESTTDYNKDDDYQLLKGDMYKVYLKEGDFCIVFPEDAHAPAMYAYNKKLKKAVVKIKVTL